MTIEYELKKISIGVIRSEQQTITDREITLSFSLSTEEKGEYFAVITGQDGKDAKIRLNNLKCELPKRFIQSQSLRIDVLQVVDERIVKRWQCQPLKLTLLDDILSATVEASVDYDALQGLYVGLVERVDGLSEVFAENKRLNIELAKQREELRAEISQDLQGLLDFKGASAKEIIKLTKSLNSIADELNNLKSELNL